MDWGCWLDETNGIQSTPALRSLQLSADWHSLPDLAFGAEKGSSHNSTLPAFLNSHWLIETETVCTLLHNFSPAFVQGNVTYPGALYVSGKFREK